MNWNAHALYDLLIQMRSHEVKLCMCSLSHHFRGDTSLREHFITGVTLSNSHVLCCVKCFLTLIILLIWIIWNELDHKRVHKMCSILWHQQCMSQNTTQEHRTCIHPIKKNTKVPVIYFTLTLKCYSVTLVLLFLALSTYFT